MRSLKYRLWLHKKLYNTRFMMAWLVFRSLAIPVGALTWALTQHIDLRQWMVVCVLRDGNISKPIDEDYIRSYRVTKTLALPEESDIIMKILRL